MLVFLDHVIQLPGQTTSGENTEIQGECSAGIPGFMSKM